MFLDTPAYNAHTLGCGKFRPFLCLPLVSLFLTVSCCLIATEMLFLSMSDDLYMGVPMITLLCNLEQSHGNNESANADQSGFGNKVRSIPTEKLAPRVGASLISVKLALNALMIDCNFNQTFGASLKLDSLLQ